MIRIMNSVTEAQARDRGVGEPLTTHELSRYEDFQQASALYRRVFGYSSEELALNSNLLSALVRNGGSAVGVRGADGELIGFAYGFLGSDESGVFHYSQAAVVEQHAQGRGIGRLLKLRQREVVLASGVSTMRWAFDPALGRNAHFNFDILGAHSAAFVRDYYGRPGTDRLLVDWPLAAGADPYAEVRAERPPASLAGAEPGAAIAHGAGRWVVVPTGEAGTARLHDTMQHLHEQGFVLVSCQRVDADVSAYLAVPAAGGRLR
ncbi:hypothetical protein SAMN05443544_1282 [Agromyces cerinus subsp. cerinus]|uniref:N-acetyltransferase domain-containing protein n=1 Tax=Agromyces cerinus subsp. cerinus TaxID=232089 RepID=A0A1N6EME0_9MICO|nr:hypothetical protein SAMN05443544_1282 [Agromyces cerinus subsp. cerinus]